MVLLMQSKSEFWVKPFIQLNKDQRKTLYIYKFVHWIRKKMSIAVLLQYYIQQAGKDHAFTFGIH